MNLRLGTICLLVIATGGASAQARTVPRRPLPATPSKAERPRWTPRQASAWAKKVGWIVGANYVPRTAINQIEMWQDFDDKTIDEELGWARKLGMNSMRVFLHDQVWRQDPARFYQRLDRFLDIAAKHGVGVMFVLFDSVWDPAPKLGPQRAPTPGVHNSGWVQSPGLRALRDRRQHGTLERYVKGVIGRFKDDPRVHAWDVWNEPDNTNGSSYNDPKAQKHRAVVELLPKVFSWARAARPKQPLTSGVWNGNWRGKATLQPWERIQLENSDVITFHSYDPPEKVDEKVDHLRAWGRPILITEYMARPKSTFQGVLPRLAAARVGAYNWGFVDGKSQTKFPWDSWADRGKYRDKEPSPWFHDIFHGDGRPYDPAEVEVIQRVIQEKTARP